MQDHDLNDLLGFVYHPRVDVLVPTREPVRELLGVLQHHIGRAVLNSPAYFAIPILSILSEVPAHRPDPLPRKPT